MTTPRDSGEPTPEAAERVHTRRLRWWVSAITLVAGFVLGVLTVGLLNTTTPNFAAAGAPGGAPAPTSSLAPTPGGTVPVVAEARVNAACLSVINEAQDVYTILTGLGQAVVDVDLQQLDDIVRRLQPIEARLGRDLQECNVDTSIVTNPTGDPSGSPTPLPSVTPTR